MKNKNTVKIGLIGLGTVGSGVVKILLSRRKQIELKTGCSLQLKRIAVRSLSKKRKTTVPKSLLTNNWKTITDDHEIDIVVEVVGGLHPAKEIILKALSRRKHVVTANKALIAENGKVLFSAALNAGRHLRFEASVCGSIPIVKFLQEGLVSNDFTKILGIVNGTCNYILSAMSERRLDFAAALREAQSLGYAEADPRFDIEGIDSAHKLAILARLAFNSAIPFREIYTEGIKNISKADIDYARELGYSVKLLAIARKHKRGLELKVHPALLPISHPLSGVRDAYNAVYVSTDHAKDLLFSGCGAGMMPTASAVMSDIIDIAGDIAKNLSVGREGRSSKDFVAPMKSLRILSVGDSISQYYLRFEVKDRPGVLGHITQTLGRNHISILSVHQKEAHTPKSVPVVILTYEAQQKNLFRALKEIDSRNEVVKKTVVIRVER